MNFERWITEDISENLHIWELSKRNCSALQNSIRISLGFWLKVQDTKNASIGPTEKNKKDRLPFDLNRFYELPTTLYVYKEMGGNVMRMCFFLSTRYQEWNWTVFFSSRQLRHHRPFNIRHVIHHLEKCRKFTTKKTFLPENLFSSRTKNQFEAIGARCSLFTQYSVLNYVIT